MRFIAQFNFFSQENLMECVIIKFKLDEQKLSHLSLNWHISGFMHSSFFTLKPLIDKQFSFLKNILQHRCLPAKPVTLFRQNLFLYSGLDFSFAQAILYPRKSVQLLIHKINKINIMFSFFLNLLCNDKSPLNSVCSKIWLL